MITKFKIFEFHVEYFKKGDFIKEFDCDVVFKITRAYYKSGDVKYEAEDIVTKKSYNFRHSIDIEPATKRDIDEYIMKNDIEKYNI